MTMKALYESNLLLLMPVYKTGNIALYIQFINRD